MSEHQIFTPAEKRGVVRSLETPDHEFLSLVVCRCFVFLGLPPRPSRNPVEKLLSVYKVMLDPKVIILKNPCWPGSRPRGLPKQAGVCEATELARVSH